jgi:ABC-type branched-subunit amino acid transport system permease subunit
VQFKGAESTGLWGVVYLAQLFFFAYGKYVIEHIAVNIHRAIFHPSGSPREFLWHHPFPIAIAIGFGLGMLPLRVLAAVMGALSTGTTERWRKLWQRTKPWIAIPFIMLFVISIISYDKGEVNAPSTWQSFFAASCSFDALHLVYRNDCVNQLLFTAPLVCALAYSATSLLEYTRNSSDRESLTGTSGNISEIV